MNEICVRDCSEKPTTRRYYAVRTCSGKPDLKGNAIKIK
jgi:hypothetical protein